MDKALEIIIQTKNLASKQLASLNRTITSFGDNAQEAGKDIDSLAKSTNKVDKEASKANKQLKKTNKTLASVGLMATGVSKNFRGLKSSIFSLKTALLAFTTGAVAKGTLDIAANFEKFEVALVTITGSAKKAKSSMDWISEFTAKTPYELSQVADGFIKLGAYGFDATKYLKVLGDTASSMGKDLNMAVEAFADAATGEFERLKEFGIKSKTVGDEVTFSWVENGVAMQKSVKKTQEEITTGLTEIWSNRFSGGMENFSKTWTGMWSNAKDQFVLFQNSIMGAGLFDHLKAALGLVLAQINKLKTEGKLDVWAKKISDSVIHIFENIAIGAAGMYEIAFPAIKSLLKTLNGFWNWFTGLPGWVQKTGLILGILGGPLGKLAAVAVMDIADSTIKLKDTLIHTYKVLSDKGYREASQLEAKFTALRKKSEAAGGVWKTVAPKDKANIGKAEDTLTGKVQGVIDKIKEAAKARKEAYEKSLNAIEEPKTKPKQIIAVSDVKKAESQLNRLEASNKYFFTKLDKIYKEGGITTSNYFDERLSKLNEFHEKQKQILTAGVEAESDPAKKLGIEDKLFALEQQHQTALVSLSQKKREEEEKVNEQRLQGQALLEDIKNRGASASGLLTAQFEQEKAEMDARHADELAKMVEVSDNKFAVEQGYINKITMLKDITRQQELEKDKLLADQKTQLLQKQLDVAMQVAGGTSDLFNNLYEATGKKQKAFFYLSKAAAVAQAMMNISQGVTKALAQGGIYGFVTGASVMVSGMAQISKIKAQSFAEGGLIGGSSPSPTADDKTINVTSGEYVQPVSAVQEYGLPIMEGIKNKVFSKDIFKNANLRMPSIPSGKSAFADGGLVKNPTPQGAGQGSANQQEIKIVNVIDPRQVLDVISSTPEGQDTILNVIDQRQTTARQILRTENDL